MQRPVRRRPARDVARPDDGVGTGVDQGEHLREHRRVVGEVDVHRHDHVVALVEGDGEAVAVGAAEALLAGAPQQLDLAQLGRRLLDDRRRAVGAVVVDDQHVGVGQRLAHPGEQRRHVLALVVRRQHDDRPGHRRRLPIDRRPTVAHLHRTAEDAQHTERRRSHVSVLARARAAVARRSRLAGSATRAAMAGPSASGATSTPVRPSTTEQR